MMAHKTPRCTCPPDSKLVFLGHLKNCPEVAATATPAPPRHLTVDDVHARGLTYRRLDHWVRAGYLHPHHQGGTGNNRTWPARELQVADLMRRLVEAGLTAGVAAIAARAHLDGRPLVRLAPGLVLAIDTDLLTEAGERCG